MKRIIVFFATILIMATAFAQSPQKMNYQAIIRDNSNALVINQAIGMQISILKDNANGVSVYVETHNVTTNTNGLVSIEIGNGNFVSGAFSTIDWADGPYFIKTETDPAGPCIPAGPTKPWAPVAPAGPCGPGVPPVSA